MKKILCLITLVFIAFVAHSQGCTTIQQEYDKITGRIMRRSESGLPIGLLKLIDTKVKDTLYYASFDTKDRVLGDRRGVTLSLTNGNDLTRSEQQADADVVGEASPTTVFVPLSRQDMKQLAVAGVKSIKLSSYNITLTDAQCLIIKQQAYCLIYGLSRVP